MSPASVILTLWVVQALVVLALIVRAALRREWAAGVGLAAGLAIGFTPLLAGSDPGASLLRTSMIQLAASTIVLVIAYSVTRRWIALALVVVIFCVPIVYSFIPAFSPLKAYPWLDAMGEIDFFLVPIACALAGRELLVWVGRLFTRSKEGMA